MIVEINCKRIIGSCPIIYIIILISMIDSFRLPHNFFILSVILGIVIIIHSTLCLAKILNSIRRSKRSLRTNASKFRVIYKAYWWFFAIFMLIISFLHLSMHLEGIYFVITCICVAIIPLVSPKSFWRVSLMTIVSYFLLIISKYFIIIPNIDDSNRLSKINELLVFCLVIDLIALFVQKINYYIWSLLTYIKIKTFIDPLTNIRNRRGANESVREIMSGMNGDFRIGVIMLDIDFFKKYNDMLGHEYGDICLKKVSSIIDTCMEGENGFALRHGGEEFVVLLFGAKEDKIRNKAQELCQMVEDSKFPCPYKEVSEFVTVSAGAALEIVNGVFDYTTILANADKNLYIAKEKGRNQAVF